MSQDELNKSNIPDPEVVPRSKRRRFNAEYKARILEEAEACSERGEIGGMVRVGIAHYNTLGEVERLLAVVGELAHYS